MTFNLQDLKNDIRATTSGKLDPTAALYLERLIELAYRLGRVEKAQEVLDARMDRSREAVARTNGVLPGGVTTEGGSTPPDKP